MEGTYRDDITAVVALLPFLDSEEEADQNDEDGLVTFNSGEKGISQYSMAEQSEPDSPPKNRRPWQPATIAEDADGEQFVKRRLSMSDLNLEDEEA